MTHRRFLERLAKLEAERHAALADAVERTPLECLGGKTVLEATPAECAILRRWVEADLAGCFTGSGDRARMLEELATLDALVK